MRLPPQGKIRQVGEQKTAALAVDLAIRRIAPDHLRDLDIEQMRRVQRLTRGEQPDIHGFRRRRAEKGFGQRRSVDDDHARSRSARTASAGATDGVVSVRLLSRIVRLMIIILAGTMALAQIGLGRHVVLIAFSISFGAVMLGAAIDFGLGGRDVARRVLENRFPEKEEKEKEEDISPL